jgi:hypothetical protein
MLENLKGKEHLGDVVVDGRIALKRILEKKGKKVMGWIKVAQQTTQWWRS